MNLPTTYQQFIHQSRYARWQENKHRRESWAETVKRYFDFFEEHLGNKAKKDRKELEKAVLNLEIMPSMRALMTAGEALHRDNVAGYNCAYFNFSSNSFHSRLPIPKSTSSAFLIFDK